MLFRSQELVLVKIVKDNPALQKQVLAELSEIANDPDNVYSNEQQLAAAQAMVAIGGKAAFASLSKEMKMQLAQAMLEKAYDKHFNVMQGNWAQAHQDIAWMWTPNNDGAGRPANYYGWDNPTTH